MYAFHLTACIVFVLAALGNAGKALKQPEYFFAVMVDMALAIWGFLTLPK